MKHIGVEIEDLAPGRCVLTALYKSEIAQQHGFFHGGLVGALVDNAGAYAAFTLIEHDQSMLTVEYKVNLIAPADGSRIRSVGEVCRAGRTLTTCQVNVFVLSQEKSVHCAVGLVTMMLLRGRGDH